MKRALFIIVLLFVCVTVSAQAYNLSILDTQMVQGTAAECRIESLDKNDAPSSNVFYVEKGGVIIQFNDFCLSFEPGCTKKKVLHNGLEEWYVDISVIVSNSTNRRIDLAIEDAIINGWNVDCFISSDDGYSIAKPNRKTRFHYLFNLTEAGVEYLSEITEFKSIFRAGGRRTEMLSMIL